MSRSRLLMVAMAVALVAPTAHAGVPSASQSYVDPCLRICPSGDMNFHVVVRDASANPIANSTVSIALCPCRSIVLCPLNGNERYAITGCDIVAVTNAAGIVDIQLRGGGTCNGPVQVFADGIPLSTLGGVSSPDQDGNASVDVIDQTILAAKFPGPDPTGDFNCSAGLDPGDQLIQNSHLGHSCAVVVPNRSTTWGRIKTIYR